jgi:very-short-patch-repair endonuclease
MWDEGEVRASAGSRLGLLDRKSATRLGLDHGAISRQLSSGRWVALHPGVYYLDTTAPPWRTRVLAAVLAAGPGAVSSHRTAGVIYELDGVFGDVIELTVPFNGDPDPDGAIVHRTRRPRPSTLVGSIPVTTVERTILDLAALLPDPVMEKAVMSALHKGLTRLELLDQVIASDGGRGVKGTRRLRRVLATTDEGLTGSAAEVEMARILRHPSFPRALTQYRVALPDGSQAYLDFAWPDLMKLVEVDGFAAHSSPESLNRDLARQNMLMELGWQIRRFSPHQIRRQPLLVRSEMERFLDA